MWTATLSIRTSVHKGIIAQLHFTGFTDPETTKYNKKNMGFGG